MRSPAHSALLLMLSGFLAQGLQFIGTIFLARIYSPDAYGNLTLIVNWASGFAVICSLQMHIAIQVEQAHAKAQGLLSAALFIVPAIAVPAAIIALILNENTFVLAIILGAALGYSNIGRAVLARNSANIRIAGLTIGRAVTVITAQFGFRFLGQGGLVLGLLVAELVAAIAFLGLSFFGVLRPTRTRVLKVILENRSFTAWGVVQELVAIGVVFMPFLICSLAYDTNVVGNYGIAYRLLWAPAVILSFGFGLVFLTELSRTPERFGAILAEVHFHKIFIFLIFAGVSSFFWMPQIFSLVLGSSWELAAIMSPAVTIAAISFLISAPFRQLYRVRQKQRLQLCIDLAITALFAATWLLPSLNPDRWIYIVCGIVVLQNALMVGVTRSFQRW